MSTNIDPTVPPVQYGSAVRESASPCHGQYSVSGCILYNADLLEELAEEHFEHQESRRLAKAKHRKKTRGLFKGHRENRN